MRSTLMAAVVLAGACDQAGGPTRASNPETPAPVLAERLDTSGYYVPLRPVEAGVYRLDFLNIGMDGPSADWQEKRAGRYSPVIAQFSDMTSPPAVSQIGIPTRSRVERVRPDHWKVTDKEVEFVDDHYRLGKITFTGRLDQSALTAVKAGRGESRPVLSGTMTVGGQKFESVDFRWTAGS